MKYYGVILLLIILTLGYYISCSISDFDRNTLTQQEITSCFNAYTSTNQPTTEDVEQRILGQWSLENFNTSGLLLLLNYDNRYFILDKDVILYSGTFNVVENNRLFSIKFESGIQELDNNIIYVCDDYIYNMTSQKIWHRSCECFIK